MAAVLAGKIDGERWALGEAVGRPSNITAVPGVFQNDQPGLECWIVSWEQVVHLGDVWEPPSMAGDEVWLAGCHDDPHYLGKLPEAPL